MTRTPSQQAAQRRMAAVLRQGHLHIWKHKGYLMLYPHYPHDYLASLLSRSHRRNYAVMMGCTIVDIDIHGRRVNERPIPDRAVRL